MSIPKQKSQKINFIIYRLKGIIAQLNQIKLSNDFLFTSLRKVYLTVAVAYLKSILGELENYNKINKEKR